MASLLILKGMAELLNFAWLISVTTRFRAEVKFGPLAALQC